MLKLERFEFLLRISRDRKCYSSLDWDREKKVWVLSFGDDDSDNDVEIEFTIEQMKEHRRMINEIYESQDRFEKVHLGEC